MADLISEISNANQYAGNAGIGGAALGAIEIDTKPLQQLAAYTVMYNKSEYEQRQKDAEAAAQEITDYTALDLTSGIEKDRKLLQEKWDKLNSFVRNNPDALNYNNKKAWAEYKKLRGELTNDIKSGGVRSALYLVRQKEIQDEKDTGEKARLQKSLDDEIAKTDIRTPLRYTDKFDIEPVKYAAPKKLSLTVAKEYPNYISLANVATTDMADVNNQANAVVTGLSKFLNPQTELEKQQFESQKNTGKLEPILSAQNISAAMAPYIKEGQFDIEAAKKSGNTILSGNVANVEAYNQKMRDMKAAIRAGAFKDKLSGGVAAFGVNGLNENDYQEIDLNKGHITPTEYAKLNIMGLAEPMVASETKIQQTDNALQRRAQDITKRGQDLDYKAAKDKLKADEEKWKAQTTGGETVKNGALERAKRIFADMQKLADKNGTISPDKIRQLNTEQLKYLGIEKVETSETGVPRTVFTPLSLSETDEDGNAVKKEYAIQLTPDGQIKVMQPKEGEKLGRTSAGGFTGLWDNSKSTNLLNVATNIANEELAKAGSKEIFTYLPIDTANIDNAVSTSTTGGTTTVSGSTKTISRGDIPAKAAAAGYSTKEYEELLKKNGVQIK